ncbi:fimbrial biogenesis outer membrane usher protein [Mesorhizobium sp. LSJC268A00]|nr:fimbria/pilus outer membrane usher protein [Mesorhizobium sp. LSJC268A00]ESW98986.1 fimbrial biogenesis outer membrane usher protein [Mesorhizobium sp. LSJC268A00]
MPTLPSRASSVAVIVAVATFTPCLAVRSQEFPAVTNLEQPASVLPAGRSLYLEVFINDVSTKLVGNFIEMPDGGLAAAPQELKEVGLKPPEDIADAGGLVRLDQLADVSFRIDEVAQRLYVTAANDSREARMLDLGLRLQDRPAPQSGLGAVLNYSLFASSNTLFDKDVELFQGVSGGFDARVFSPYGTLSQSFIAGYSDGRLGGFTRLNTTWSYSDPDRLMTYRAGDFISGGLSWTRPVYLGGIQAQRNFHLRSDLVTLPLPSFGGTAAVPSTLEVYTQNVRTYSGDIQPGPFQVTNLPVFTGAGQAQVVDRKSTRLNSYASSMLLRQGLLDFSVEAGMARRNFGISSDDYDSRVMGVASARYGVTDRLTLEAHAEGGADLINGGIGAAFPLGAYGAASLAVAGSHHDGRTGSLVDARAEFGYDGWAINARMQRSFGGFEDIASVTAQPVILDPDDFTRFSAGVPRARSEEHTSELKDAEGETSQIVGLSYSQEIFKRSTLYATAFADLDDGDSYGIFAGISIPFNDDVMASTGVEHGPDGLNVVADLAKSERAEDGSIGWRLRTSEGEVPNRSAAVSYRASFARFEAGAQQFDKDFRVTGQMDGAIAVAGGGVFATNRIDDAFAVVDVGTPDVEVLHQNRPVGRTDSKGRILVTGLNSYELNTVSIDPKNLPVDADVPATKETVVPADRNGVVLKFGVSEAAQAALVTLVDSSGTPLEAGLSGRVDGGTEDFVVGYDGQAYIKGLGKQNSVQVERADGGSCRAEFPFEAARGRQVVIGNVVCQ